MPTTHSSPPNRQTLEYTYAELALGLATMRYAAYQLSRWTPEVASTWITDDVEVACSRRLLHLPGTVDTPFSEVMTHTN
ncbi:MAG: hypothetical protein AAF970_08375 [Bacteroidota bacterium]